MLLFDGGTLTPDQAGRIRLPAEELRSWAWCDEHEAEERLPDLLARRMKAAVRALTTRASLYLENGFPPG